MSVPAERERRSRRVRAIWAACLVLAGLNHARTLLQHGLAYDYGGAGWWFSSAYWTGLTLIDPLVAALLFVKPRSGIVCTIILIATNVVHNMLVTAQWAGWTHFAEAALSAPQFLLQIAFLLFVLATAGTAWRGLPATA